MMKRHSAQKKLEGKKYQILGRFPHLLVTQKLLAKWVEQGAGVAVMLTNYLKSIIATKSTKSGVKTTWVWKT